mmetsp:Transcript_18050/g.41056  ORF Transcript_18050/g.41056 Transcript_18050/m.41056 type:complete len:332 (+) Transcript_18050:3521-4516(+)
MHKIDMCDYSFSGRAWKKISNEAKDFVSSLLKKNPSERLKAGEAHKSPWFEEVGGLHKASHPLRTDSIGILHSGKNGAKKPKHRRTSSGGHLKRTILMDIARNSSDLLDLRKAFKDIDLKGDGTLTFEEFEQVFFKGQNFSVQEKRAMFNDADYYKNGKIAYTEFLAFAMEWMGEIEDSKILDAFKRMDVSNDGFISQNDIQNFLQCSEETAKDLIAESDFSSDGKITQGEFLMFVRGKEEIVQKKILEDSVSSPKNGVSVGIIKQSNENYAKSDNVNLTSASGGADGQLEEVNLNKGTSLAPLSNSHLDSIDPLFMLSNVKNNNSEVMEL